MKSVIQKCQCVKIDKYYFRNYMGRIFKYSQFCRRKNFKTESSYNYENLKRKYCFKHKKEDMVNTKRGHKLCLKYKSSYKTKCVSKQCKYTIDNYKSASKYMKLKTIDYLKKITWNSIYVESAEKLFLDHILMVKKTLKKLIVFVSKSFISIKSQFFDTRYNYIYTDLYFKNHIKNIILKNIDDTKYYKSYIITKIC